MATTYKLSYFNARGAAEVARLLLTLADIKYEDYRYSLTIDASGVKYDQTFFDLKAEGDTFPFGQVPIVEITNNDQTILLAQSHAIERYLARENGFYGKNNLEDALIDSVDEHIRDGQTKLWATLSSTDEAKTAFFDVYLLKHMEYLNRFIETHSTADKTTCFGSSISLPDASLFSFITNIQLTSLPAYEKIMQTYPQVNAVYQALANHPNITAWVARRPQTLI